MSWCSGRPRRRVAELVGYLGFVPAARPGLVAGVHPDRVAAGADPARGLVVTGTVAGRPAERRRLGGGPARRRRRVHLPAARRRPATRSR